MTMGFSSLVSSSCNLKWLTSGYLTNGVAGSKKKWSPGLCVNQKIDQNVPNTPNAGTVTPQNFGMCVGRNKMRAKYHS
jgi:hypothetical protein